MVDNGTFKSEGFRLTEISCERDINRNLFFLTFCFLAQDSPFSLPHTSCQCHSVLSAMWTRGVELEPPELCSNKRFLFLH